MLRILFRGCDDLFEPLFLQNRMVTQDTNEGVKNKNWLHISEFIVGSN